MDNMAERLLVILAVRSVQILLRLEASRNFIVMLVLEVINDDLFIEMLPTLFALEILRAVDVQVLLLIGDLIESKITLCDWAQKRPLASMNS
jgi:hypothetical protein